jgi:hypothetical protein
MKPAITYTRGDHVRYWFDDGRGGSWLHGEVVKAGAKTFTVVWESGIQNRLAQGHHLVERREVPANVTLRIGREQHVVADLRAAVALHAELRDDSGMGARDWPPCSVTAEGKRYRVSYNGRVWDGEREVEVA